MPTKVVVVLEVRTRAPAEMLPTLSLVLEKAVHAYAQEKGLSPGGFIPLTDTRAWLASEIDSVRVCDLCVSSPILPGSPAPLSDGEGSSSVSHVDRTTSRSDPTDETDHAPSSLCEYAFVFYHLHGAGTTTAPVGSSGAVPLYTTGTCEGTAGEDESGASGNADSASQLPCCSSLALPHATLDGLWESLYYGESLEDSVALKKQLLQYVVTALRFSQHGVDPNLITWNRMLLFHGPPGTGKTSLAKALAQKLAIRLQSGPFPRARLIEVSAHSLFSRWFSESGKQVTQLFEGIRQLASDSACLVCVLLDEVESLAATRQAAMRGNEPSDAIRVVNALLTQIDALQRFRNVLVLTTSNLTDAVDPAFADRADMKIHVGPPGYEARRAMLQASVTELVKRGLLQIPTRDHLSLGDESTDLPVSEAVRDTHDEILLLARVSLGLNGRTLKKLPFLAYGFCQAAAHYTVTSDAPATAVTPSVSVYVRYLRKAILRVLADGEDGTATVSQADTTQAPPTKSVRTEEHT